MEDDLIINGELVLSGAVVPDEWVMWGDGFSARMVVRALARFSGDVVVRLNSGGGDPFEGEAIRAALEAHPANVEIRIEGIAASAASLIAMGGDRILMSAGSLMMIHDPSSCICGNEAELRREAAQLDYIAETYAKIYAARAGITAAAARSLMKAETWMDADDAITNGFADGRIGDEAETASMNLAAGRAAFRANQTVLRMCAEKQTQMAGKPPSAPAGNASSTPANAATTRNIDMENDDVVTTPQAAPVTPPPSGQSANPPANPASTQMSATDREAIQQRAIADERARAMAIRAAAQPFMASQRLTGEQLEELVALGLSTDATSTRMLAMIADAPSAPRSRITRDETETRVEGMIGALMHRASPRMHRMEGPATDFRGMGLRSMALALSNQRGYNTSEMVRAGLRSTTMMGGAHGVGDFAYITAEVMNRMLRAEYERRPSAWRRVSRERSASDFRELLSTRFGGDFSLKPVLENGEYKQTTLVDEAEGLKVVRYGREIRLTFEAIVNDDLGAFEQIPSRFANAASQKEAATVWGIIRSNAVMKSDSKALFHADHGNLASGGANVGAPSIDLVGKAYAAMLQQRAVGETAVEEFIGIQPNLLIVPPVLHTVAAQFVTTTTPAEDGKTNPYKFLDPITEPLLGAAAGGSDTAWYLVDENEPPVEHAYLEGYEQPTIVADEGMSPDVVTMTARHIFGAAPAEFRGAWKNPGA